MKLNIRNKKSILSAFALVGILVACGISSGPSLKRPTQTVTSPSRSVAQPAMVPCDPMGSPFGGGDGTTSATAFSICTLNQFNQIQSAASAFFVLAADIDLSSGYSTQNFSGTLDGNRHVLQNLTLSGIGHQVMFYNVPTGSLIKDLGFTDVNITSMIGGSGDGGAPITWENDGTITGTFAKGSIACSGGTNLAGGLVVINNGTISNSYTVMMISDATGASSFGGLAQSQTSGTVATSYSVPTFVIASGTVVGGLTQSGPGPSNTSFWDATVSGTTSTGGSGNASALSTAQMQQSATYSSAGWDSAVWYTTDGSYPKFIWEN